MLESKTDLKINRMLIKELSDGAYKLYSHYYTNAIQQRNQIVYDTDPFAADGLGCSLSKIVRLKRELRKKGIIKPSSKEWNGLNKECIELIKFTKESFFKAIGKSNTVS